MYVFCVTYKQWPQERESEKTIYKGIALHFYVHLLQGAGSYRTVFECVQSAYCLIDLLSLFCCCFFTGRLYVHWLWARCRRCIRARRLNMRQWIAHDAYAGHEWLTARWQYLTILTTNNTITRHRTLLTTPATNAAPGFHWCCSLVLSLKLVFLWDIESRFLRYCCVTSLKCVPCTYSIFSENGGVFVVSRWSLEVTRLSLCVCVYFGLHCFCLVDGSLM